MLLFAEIFLDSYVLQSENSLLTFREPPKYPLPWREGMKRGGGKFLFFTPTLSLPRRRGRGSDEENFKYLWLNF